jgi:hypothetical protein
MIFQRALGLAAGLAVMMMFGHWGHEQWPTADGQPAAAQAVRAITHDPATTVSRLPADFPAVMGYRPSMAFRMRHPVRWLGAASVLALVVQPARLPHPAGSRR